MNRNTNLKLEKTFGNGIHDLNTKIFQQMFCKVVSQIK